MKFGIIVGSLHRESFSRKITKDVARLLPESVMAEWKNKLDAFLNFNDAELSDGVGKITHEIAKTFVESEFEKYRVIQDTSYQSDFDKLLAQTQNLLGDK